MKTQELNPAAVAGDISERQIRATPQARPLNPQTVAVLPFHNQSADPEQECFCDGITDDIIHALSRIPRLNVIGRTSSYAKRGRDAKEAGLALGAGTVVTGSVRKSGSLVRIYAEMIDATAGDVKWAETYERPMSDVFVVKVEVAKAVARNLHARASLRGMVHDAPSMDAYLIYLRGRSAMDRATEWGFRKAAEVFERAVSLYPSYASAHAGLSDSYVRLALWGYSRPLEVLPKAVRAAETAIKLDAFSPYANAIFAISKAWSEWSWKEGLANASKAIEFAPSDPFAQQVYGFTLLHGDVEDALECFERCVTLDPYSISDNRVLGYALYLARRFASAEQWLLAADALDETPETSILLARSYLCQKHFQAAMERARQGVEHPTGLSVLGACMAYLNRREEALNVLTQLEKMAETRWIQPRSFVRMHLALGDKDRAIEYLAKSLEEREPFSLFIKHDPEFDPLRGDPRFDEMVARLDKKFPLNHEPQGWELQEMKYAGNVRRNHEKSRR